ncbi:MAG TPA: hypothetical protein PLP64_05385 [Pseudothermotoga sp.]|nr:hypothetical protein [Pseudothermotoga sp.]HOK83642.1 hypothetical protein [Pseudothermotoga sp.]HPP69281.1 hypothetical protein [Pseudothermotoga sp.]
MNEENFQKFLDGEIGKDELDQETKQDVKTYTLTMQVMKARYDYKPSAVLEERVMSKVRKKRELFSELLIAASVVAALFFIVFNVMPVKIPVTAKTQQVSVSEVFDYLSLVKLVGDGF